MLDRVLRLSYRHNWVYLAQAPHPIRTASSYCANLYGVLHMFLGQPVRIKEAVRPRTERRYFTHGALRRHLGQTCSPPFLVHVRLRIHVVRHVLSTAYTELRNMLPCYSCTALVADSAQQWQTNNAPKYFSFSPAPRTHQLSDNVS